MSFNDGNPTQYSGQAGWSSPGHGVGATSASLSDLLTAVQHVASNIALLGQTLLQINGQTTRTAMTATAGAQLLKQGPGRVATVAVTVAGGANNPTLLVDSNSATATSPVIATVPGTVGVYVVNMPFSLGLVVIPGTGDTVSVSFS